MNVDESDLMEMSELLLCKLNYRYGINSDDLLCAADRLKSMVKWLGEDLSKDGIDQMLNDLREVECVIHRQLCEKLNALVVWGPKTP
jgi:hypothetical protein